MSDATTLGLLKRIEALERDLGRRSLERALATVIDVRSYGAKFDGQVRNNATVTSGSPTLDLPLGGSFTGFTAADVGKRIVVIKVTGTGNTAVESCDATGTIVAVVSPTRVTMSVSALFTYTGTARVYWGTDDTAALQAAFNLSTVNSVAGYYDLPEGIAMISSRLDFFSYGGRISGKGSFVDPERLEYGTVLVGCTAGMSVLRIAGNDTGARGVAIDGGGKTAAVGLDMAWPSSGLHWSSFYDLAVSACGDGYLFDYEHFGNNFFGCAAKRNTRGVATQRTGPGAIQKVAFFGFSGEVNSDAAADLTSVEQFSFLGGTMMHSPTGLRVNGSTNVNADYIQFEGCTNAAIDLVKTSPSSAVLSVDTMGIDRNWITNCGVGIRGRGARGVVIGAANRYQLTTTAYDFDDTGQTGALNSRNSWDPQQYPESTGLGGGQDGLYYTQRPPQVAVASGDFTLPGGTETLITGCQMDLAPGNWLVVGVFDIDRGAGDTGNTLYADLTVPGGGLVTFQSDSAELVLGPAAADRRTYQQMWWLTVYRTATISLRGGKGATGGTSLAKATSTKLVATYAGGVF